ncbi:277_t:CDS:2 [Ambispora leptoticha]|uniref:277_t:CDS:1 n=1 Tax=Ambispora leptoticha TaxID=144679 RepID=A0A9N9DHP5_9GLOM|nr:277_t:CDS:2 [Ambispora leptoticha]
MANAHGPSLHEFTINNILNVSTELYSPPFATSSEMFWQLRFVSESTKHPQYCELFLFAIPNEHEKKGQGVWERRNSCAAYIYIKNSTQGYIAKKAIEKQFSCAEQSWGSRKFCKRSLLPPNIIIGVEFDKCQTSTQKQKSPFPPESTSKDLVKAWYRQLNNPQMADLKLVVQGQAIYASSCILSARSEYFCQMLKGTWMESIQSDGFITIEITDFTPSVVLQMLEFLYTNKVSLGNVPTPMETLVSIIADKYLIKELRSICYLKIMDELTVDDAAEILFSSGWKWDDLKADLMKFVVKNFTKVRETPGFYQIMQNSADYPNFAEILGEIHSSLIPSS